MKVVVVKGSAATADVSRYGARLIQRNARVGFQASDGRNRSDGFRVLRISEGEDRFTEPTRLSERGPRASRAFLRVVFKRVVIFKFAFFCVS